MKYLASGLTLVLLLALSYQIYAIETEPVAEPILVEEVPQDHAIVARLSAITQAIAGLEQVEVTVNAGVLSLNGEVASGQLSRDIEQIASRLEGVVYVQNNLQEQLAVRSRLAPASEKFQEILNKALRMLPLLLLALVVIVIFSLLGAWLAKRSGWLKRLGLSELTSNLGMRFVRLVITAIGVLIALELLDATALVSAALGIAGVIGIALGFAFRNIVENYLAGVLLSTRNPFAVGDQIQVGEFSGSVVRLTSRDTVLMTYDGNHLRIPNSDIITSALTNFSRNPLRRFGFKVGVSVELDLVSVRQLGITTLTGMPGVLTEPAPRCLVAELGDSTVLLQFYAWINQSHTDFLKARSEAIRLVKLAFDEAGIEMPEPIYRIHMAEPSLTKPQSVAKTPATERTTAATPATTLDIDVSTDDTIPDQVAADLASSDEENLLAKSR
jgi:small conductance mechanosensitive channel